MVGEVKRAVRVAERVREELAWLLARDVRDPRCAGVTVSRVEMPDDLRLARVFVRLLEGGDSEERRREAMTGLQRAAGMLRTAVGRGVGLRFAPELRFAYDDGQEKQARVEKLLAEVEHEKRTPAKRGVKA